MLLLAAQKKESVVVMEAIPTGMVVLEMTGWLDRPAAAARSTYRSGLEDRLADRMSKCTVLGQWKPEVLRVAGRCECMMRADRSVAQHAMLYEPPIRSRRPQRGWPAAFTSTPASESRPAVRVKSQTSGRSPS